MINLLEISAISARTQLELGVSFAVMVVLMVIAGLMMVITEKKDPKRSIYKSFFIIGLIGLVLTAVVYFLYLVGLF